MKKVEKEPELIPICEGFTFDLGDKKIEVFETPGHTEGCLCFLSRSDRIMFSGDTFNPLMLMFWRTRRQSRNTAKRRKNF